MKIERNIKLVPFFFRVIETQRKFGRTRNAVGTRAASQSFPQLTKNRNAKKKTILFTLIIKILFAGAIITSTARANSVPAARVFYISLVFSNARCVLSQYYTRLRLLYLLIG